MTAPSENVVKLKTTVYGNVVFNKKKHLHKASDPLLDVERVLKWEEKKMMGQK